ncbi:MAG: lipid IV(A) 3-deoxy-D-manno-octulosonic acid transferase [Burkholderiaceae bacterium]|nr:lipid IV(A) 3-deoxy-D-manno-octulosonic acid transferase [Rhodoferax sp.]MCP5283661.1 lipid IV(A) 3-deoxy-D-manno-octulosonic acid transferase [Burkholderiaceae bacterium]
MMLRLYSALMHALRVVAWPVLWWLGRRVPAYRARWHERRGRAALPAAARGGVLIHAASMGEVQAALPLLNALRSARPDLPLVFTCTSPTASARIVEACGAAVHHVYLPFDTPGAVRRFLDAANPRLLVVMETELWPNLLTLAQARGTAVVLANGRLSAGSARRYARLPGLTHPLLAALDLLLVQDDAARERLLALGAAPARVAVTGNLKFDSALPAGHGAQVDRFAAWVGPRPLWVAASTHEGEEAVVVDAVRHLQATAPGLLLVLVPRHPQRFEGVVDLLAASGLRWQRRSDAQPVTPDTQVLLVDAMGELTAWMALAKSVFMGGTLVPVGGHNPLEAMQFGVPLLAGPARFNFADAFNALEAADAVQRVNDAPSLAAALLAWHQDPAAAQAAGERGQALFMRSGGATARTLAPLLALLDHRPQRHDAADGCVWVDPALIPQADLAPFDPATGAPAGHGSGRGTVWWQQAGGLTLLLRHYRRGGLVGRLIRDRFLREPGRRSRAMAEFALLQRLLGWGLPVPRPAAARWQSAGPLHYRADILLQRLDGAQDLSVTLQQRALSAGEWAAVGSAVAAMHAHGVDHADLNCHNLMHAPDAAAPDGGRVWIIDFDRGAVRAPGPWQAANLARLRRSLRKEATRLPRWHWDETTDWAALQAAYDVRYEAARKGAAEGAVDDAAPGAAITSTAAR